MAVSSAGVAATVIATASLTKLVWESFFGGNIFSVRLFRCDSDRSDEATQTCIRNVNQICVTLAMFFSLSVVCFIEPGICIDSSGTHTHSRGRSTFWNECVLRHVDSELKTEQTRIEITQHIDIQSTCRRHITETHTQMIWNLLRSSWNKACPKRAVRTHAHTLNTHSALLAQMARAFQILHVL